MTGIQAPLVASPRPVVIPQFVPRSLRRNISWAFLGNAVYAACQWALLVIIARLGTPTAVGQFALGLALSAPIMMFTNLQLRAVLVTDVRADFSLAQYFGMRVMLSLAAFAATVALALFFGYSRETLLVVAFISIAKVAESVSDICHAEMQFQERMDTVSQSLIVRGLLSVVVVAGQLLMTESLVIAIASFAALWSLVALFVDTPLMMRITAPSRRFSFRQSVVETVGDAQRMGRLFWTSLPLGVVMGLISLNVNIPRYFLEGSWGEAELGVFAALAYIVVAGNIMVHAVGQSVSPRLSRMYAAGETEAFSLLLFKFLGLSAIAAVVGTIGALFLGEPFLTLMYGHEYSAHHAAFVWIVAAGGISMMTSFLGFAVTSMRAFREQLAPFLVVAVVTVMSSWILVPKYGVLGASWVVGIGTIVNLLYLALVYCAVLKRG